MIDTLKQIMRGILMDSDGTYSGTKVLSAVCVFVFLVVSCYLAYRGITWGNYESFSTATGLGGLGLRGVNKYINIKKFSGGE